MNIINKVNTELLGELVCIADSDGNSKMWGKYKECSLFKEQNKIFIGMDLYCYNENFETNIFSVQRGLDAQNKLAITYKKFLDDLDDGLETIILKKIDDFLDEEEISISTVKLQDIKAVEIRIYMDGYAVIMKVPFLNHLIGFQNRKIFDENNWKNVNFEDSIDPVEMKYGVV